MDDNGGSRYPSWFRLEPDGPHKKSGGLGTDGYNYEFYCAKDGEPWPCATEREHSRARAKTH
ncbi:hypothetical protein [Stackebrandtia nassauensis]|uniref:Uncharacterized protein n=1 Tax=Stackebrandtia nassauensis (strain DSM 44728 / CIP 108903 / NRRL B-16338 / NBRC 102104 / LLR-40K-21) TaxID=446470 RepID=D3Q698_STANL|nr:hypothetical protein [Stackebrandtia nassauensis]ADD42273.1 hypothetical protein Snas_2594 [Stackebrandtia nassauensis DSM 44728]